MAFLLIGLASQKSLEKLGILTPWGQKVKLSIAVPTVQAVLEF